MILKISKFQELWEFFKMFLSCRGGVISVKARLCPPAFSSLFDVERIFVGGGTPGGRQQIHQSLVNTSLNWLNGSQHATSVIIRQDIIRGQRKKKFLHHNSIWVISQLLFEECLHGHPLIALSCFTLKALGVKSTRFKSAACWNPMIPYHPS